MEHFPVSLRLFKIYVADQKLQTIMSFFPVYTSLCLKKDGLMTTQTQTLKMLNHSGCNISWKEIPDNIGKCSFADGTKHK